MVDLQIIMCIRRHVTLVYPIYLFNFGLLRICKNTLLSDSMNMSTRGVKIETVVGFFLAMKCVLKYPKVSYSIRMLFKKLL